MAFCSSCGKENVNNAQFCSSCGAPTGQAPQFSSQPQPMYTQPQPMHPSPYTSIDRTKYVVKAIIAMVLGFICGGCLCIPTGITALVYLIIAENKITLYPTAEENPYYMKSNLWSNITFWLAGIQLVFFIGIMIFAAVAEA